jgi:hypothetical protein
MFFYVFFAIILLLQVLEKGLHDEEVEMLLLSLFSPAVLFHVPTGADTMHNQSINQSINQYRHMRKNRVIPYAYWRRDNLTCHACASLKFLE